MNIPERTQFVPECGIDTALNIVIIFDDKKKFIDHQHGIHNIEKVFKRPKLMGWRIIGIIDNDKKNTPAYFDEFEVIEASQTFDYKKHPQHNHHLFVLKPAADTVLFNACTTTGIKPSAYGFSDEKDGFIDDCKPNKVEENPSMIRLIKAVKKAGGFKEIEEIIQRIISEQQ